MPAPPERTRRRRRRLGGALAVLLVLGLGAGYRAVASLGPFVVRAEWPPASDLAEYTAVLHVHSRYSHDGRGSVEEVAAAARPGQTAAIRVPPVGDALVRLMRNGVVLLEARGDRRLTVPLPGPGVYRVEVARRGDLFPIGGMAFRPWIFSSPA
jgi:hypothetical protein